MAVDTDTNTRTDTEPAETEPEFGDMIERIYEEERARGGFEDGSATARSAPASYQDESATFFIGREFTLKEFGRWFKAQRLGSRPYNAVGYHHTWKPTPQTWAGVPSLKGIFNFFRDERGWPEGLGPQIWVYSGEGRYTNGSPRIYVGTHPAHDGAGINFRNGRWLHIEHIWDGDKASFSEPMKAVSGAVLAIVCAPHPHADRTIPYTFVRKGVNNPDTPLGIMYHRDENPNWAPGQPPKSCPGLKVSHDNLDADLVRHANAWTANGGSAGSDGEPIEERGVFTVGATANVRSGPSRDQPELRTLAAGTAVDIDGHTDGGEDVNGSARWYRLKDEAGSASGVADFVSETGALTVGAVANVRSDPSRAQPELRSLTVGTAVDTSGYTDAGEEVDGSARWYRLKDEDAWVHDSGGTYERRSAWVHDSGGTYERRTA